jgi:hypothetical protein
MGYIQVAELKTAIYTALQKYLSDTGEYISVIGEIGETPKGKFRIKIKTKEITPQALPPVSQ